MAKRFIIFKPDGRVKLAFDWRQDRNQVEAILAANMDEGYTAVEVTPSGTDSLQTLLTNLHRCEATLRQGNIESIAFLQADSNGQVTPQTRVRQPDAVIAEMATRQYTKRGGELVFHSRKEVRP